jgi:hypothetical protein
MPVINAKEKIHKAIMENDGVVASIHRFGGTEYKLGKREIGHVHGIILWIFLSLKKSEMS